MKSEDELERAVRAEYDLAGHNSILLRGLLRKARVALWSGLPDAEVRAVGLEPVHSLAEGLDWLGRMCPGDFRCGLVPHANVTYASSAELRDSEDTWQRTPARKSSATAAWAAARSTATA